MKKDPNALQAPNAFLMALEGRMPWEFGASLAAYPLLRGAPAGDGHPVLVFPGLAASDITTLPLRVFLRERGYRPHGWDQRMNLGPRAGVIEQSLARAIALDLATGTWFYRVRGLNQIQSHKPQMEWSAPVRLSVAKPSFRLVAATK